MGSYEGVVESLGVEHFVNVALGVIGRCVTMLKASRSIEYKSKEPEKISVIVRVSDWRLKCQ